MRTAQTNAEMLGMTDSQSMLSNMDKVNGLLAQTGTNLPMNWATLGARDKEKFLNDLEMKAQTSGSISNKLVENTEHQEKMLGDMQNLGVNLDVMAGKKTFNLKKAQLNPTQNVIGTPPPANTEPVFASGADVKNWLDGIGSPIEAIQSLSKRYSNSNQVIRDPETNSTGDALGLIKDAVSDFYSTEDEQQRLENASMIFKLIIPDGEKANPQGDSVPAKFDQHIHASVMNTNEFIKKLAQEHIRSTTQKQSSVKFNLKQAQHKSIENVITYGPGQTHVDAFTGQMISDWHLMERNKGFGLRIDDVYNIDWESIWRNTIMDKYSRPYRDKEGKWVGGYIEGRFETDKNIPPLNDLQIKPGSKRRPVVKEHGNTESRLEAVREKNESAGSDPTKFFNLKKAKAQNVLKTACMSCSACGMACSEKTESGMCPTCTTDNKKKVEAQIKPLGNPRNENMRLPGDAPVGAASNPNCPVCGGNLNKGQVGPCQNCGNNVGTPNQTPAYLQQVPKNQIKPTVQKNQLMASGIFYNGKKFISSSAIGKVEFDTFEQAEKHFAQVQPVQPQQSVPPVIPAVPNKPLVRRPVPNKNRRQVKSPEEITQSADNLGIDG